MYNGKLHPFAPANRIKTLLLSAGLIAFILVFGSRIADALRLVLCAAFICFLVSPLCRLLERRMSRPLAALLSILGCLFLIVSAACLLLPHFARHLMNTAQILPEALERLDRFSAAAKARLNAILPGFTLPDVQTSSAEMDFTGFIRDIVDSIGNIAGKIYQLVLTVVLSYFLLRDRQKILLRLELLFPAYRRKTAVKTGNILLRELRLYLRGQATIALAVGLLAGIGLAVIGVPSGILLGAIVGLFNVIPYFGPILGGILSVILALGISWQKAAMTICLLFLVQQIDGLVISPRVMGNITGFPPAVVLLALFIASHTGGIAGMILVMPLLMCARTLYRVFVQNHEND